MRRTGCWPESAEGVSGFDGRAQASDFVVLRGKAADCEVSELPQLVQVASLVGKAVAEVSVLRGEPGDLGVARVGAVLVWRAVGRVGG
ncbi:hypothetical protein DMP23_47225 [Amycolatopsis sp. A1MSW2902]|uniref:hypothetical protein n=1 Tax=Amycolatopsis sp. A1MSW2902 TaxID=687413 RepID=UPI00307E115D